MPPICYKFSFVGLIKPAMINVFAIALLAAASTALGTDRISVYTEQFYPLNYTENGEDDAPIVGFATQLVIAVLEEARLKYDIKMVPWVRAMRAINTEENVLVYSMARTSEREKQFHWVGDIFPITSHLYGLKENANSLPRSLEDAANFKVAVVRNYPAHRYLAAQGFSELVLVTNSVQKLEMLKRGRIDLIPFNDARIGLFIRNHGFDRDDFIGMISIDHTATEMYIALGKNTDAEIVSRMQIAYANVKASGKYDEIMDPMRSVMIDNQVDVIDATRSDY